MTLFWDIEIDFQRAKQSMEEEDYGWWKPIISHITSAQELIDTLSQYTIKFCIGRHRNEDFWINPPKLWWASFDARCVDSVNNAACAHNTRLRHLLDLWWGTLWIWDGEHKWCNRTLEQYEWLEQSIHLPLSDEIRNHYQREFGREVMMEILEVKTALEIALNSRVNKG